MSEPHRVCGETPHDPWEFPGVVGVMGRAAV